MPRKKIEVDLEQVEDMASEFCTQEEIADDMGFERTLFHRRKDVAAAFSRGKNSAKMSLRHMMYNAAKSGDRSVMIFLAKNELGYRDNPEQSKQEQTKNGLLPELLAGLKEPYDIHKQTKGTDGEVQQERTVPPEST